MNGSVNRSGKPGVDGTSYGCITRWPKVYRESVGACAMADKLPLDAFYDLTQITSVALSPDAERVAFAVSESDPDEDERVASLFVVPTDGSREPHRLTQQAGAGSPKWSPDGDRLAFLAARDEDVDRRIGRDEGDAESEGEEAEDGDGEGDEGDDEPKTQVWLFDLGLGGDARQVTDRDEGVREFDWSPDGERLVVSARDPTDEEKEYLDERKDDGPIVTERLQHKLDGAGYLDTVTTYLFVVDLDSGEEQRLDDAYGGGAFEALTGLDPQWGPDGRIAFLSCRTERPDDTLVRDVYTIRPDGSDLAKLTDSELSVAAPRWGPDGERLAFVGSDPVNWCIPSQVYCHDGETYESLTADLDRTLSWGGTPEWADEGTLYTVIGDEGHSRPIRIDLAGSGVGDGDEADASAASVTRVFDAQGEYRSMSALATNGEIAVAVLSHPSEGQDVFAVDVAEMGAEAEPDAETLRRLTAVNDDLVETYEMPQCRRISFDSHGWDVDAVVYAPPDFDFDDPDPHPTVVAIHGGPVSYDEPTFAFDHAVFTTRGYLVVRVNYRGGSSYGREFAETLWGRWGTVEVEDLVAGIEAVVDRGWTDPDRVFGNGFSYGGIAQGYLVTQTDLLTAAAPEHGIYDMRSTYGTDDSHVWMENEFGLPWENQGAIDASSSINDIADLSTPLLVMAGDEDWRCPPSQSEQLYVSAKKRGVDAKLVVYPGEHHNVGDPDRAIHRLEQITEWYERHDPAGEDDGDDGNGDE